MGASLPPHRKSASRARSMIPGFPRMRFAIAWPKAASGWAMWITSFSMAIPLWLREKLFLKDLLRKEFRKIDGAGKWNGQLLFSEHHLSHAASAFFPSPFEEAVVLTMDGVGDWATTSAAIGKGNSLEVIKEIQD